VYDVLIAAGAGPAAKDNVRVHHIVCAIDAGRSVEAAHVSAFSCTHDSQTHVSITRLASCCVLIHVCSPPPSHSPSPTATTHAQNGEVPKQPLPGERETVVVANTLVDAEAVAAVGASGNGLYGLITHHICGCLRREVAHSMVL
jgi:hypothetical protein